MMDDFIYPHATDIERAILGAMIMDRDALTVAIGQNLDNCFYKPAHAILFKAMKEMNDAGTPVDHLTLYETLQSSGDDDKIGGMPAISAMVMEAANTATIEYYAKIVYNKALLRKMIMVSITLKQHCLEDNADPLDIISKADQDICSVIEQTKAAVRTRKVSDILPEAVELIEKRASAEDGVAGVPTGFIRLNEITSGWQPGNYIIIGAPPGEGKSNLAAHFAVAAASAHYPTILYTMEMTQVEVTERLIARESRIETTAVHQNKPTPYDWERITDGCAVLSNWPLYIDDTPGMTIVELSARMKNAVKKYGIRLAIVDYLQLMPGMGESGRQIQVETISRGMKKLAGVLRIPIIAVSQYNRQKEQGRRPMLSDLRDCLAVNTSQIYYSDTIKYPCKYGGKVVSLNINKGDTTMSNSEIIPRKSNIVYRVKTESGRYVDATAKQPILTSDGFKKVSELSTSDSVAVPVDFGEWEGKEYIPEAKFIGWMLGNGYMRGYPAPSFITNDADVAKEFCDFVEKRWGFVPKTHKHKCKKVFQYDLTYCSVRTKKPNITKSWCVEHDLWGNTAKDKYIPEWFIEKANKQSVVELLTGLWETDGSVDLGQTHRRLSYSTTSGAMVNQILYLLSKIGIFAYVDDGYLSPVATTKCYKITIESKEFIDKFNEIIKLTGYKGKKQRQLSKTRDSYFTNRLGRNTSISVDEYIHSLCPRSVARIQIHGGRRTTKSHLIKSLAEMKKYTGLKTTPYDWLCSEHIVWDGIESITSMGEQEVFDLSVENTHNFIVNGIVVHNSGSLEQDANIILFLHQPSDEDIQNNMPHAPAQHEVRVLIIGKGRSLPKKDIPIRFRPEISSFFDFNMVGGY